MDSAVPWLVTAFAVVMVSLGVLSFVVRATDPWDGTEWQQSQWGNPRQGAGIAVRPVSPVANVAEGDAVVAIDGQPVATLVRPPFDLVGIGPVDALTYEVASPQGSRSVSQPLVHYPLKRFLEDWTAILASLALLGIAAYVFARRRRDPAAQLLLMGAATFVSAVGWHWLSINELVMGPALGLSELASPLGFLGYSAFAAFAFVYPRPSPWLIRHRTPAIGLALVPSLLSIIGLGAAQVSGEPFLSWHAQLAPIEPATLVVAFGVLVVGVPLRFRSLRGPADRRRYLLLIGSLLLIAMLMTLVWIVPSVAIGHPLLPWTLTNLLMVPFVIAAAFGILRFGAFELELLLNRSLVYGALTVAVALIYLVLVGGTMLLVRAQFGFAAALLATGLVALLLQPMRNGLQRAANRLMYGDREEPYRALARLGTRIESSLAPAEVLRAVVDTVAESLRVPYVAVALNVEEGTRVAASRGARRATALRLPLVHQGERVGELLVAPRDGDGMGDRDRQLLGDLVRQAGPAAFAVRLQDELRRSRERLVATREEERRRLRRDLHDGLGPVLAGTRLQLQAAQASLPADTDRTQRILEHLEAETREAIGEVRRMARDLRPPALDELGVAGALRQRAAHFSVEGRLQVEVLAPDELPPLPAAVEVAAYRIALEALTNVVRHARAGSCWLRLELDGMRGREQVGELRVEVRDDGIGLDAAAAAGIGLRSMRERVDELGGSLAVTSSAEGTVILARLPARVA